MAHHTILVIDDQSQIPNAILRKLESEGFQVTTANAGAEALEALSHLRPDVILLELGCPGADAFHFCKRLRERSEAPIVVLSQRAEEADVVSSLEMGADDYLARPFRINELVARIRAHLRRPALGLPQRPLAEQEELQVGALWLSQRTHEVGLHGKHIELTPTEFRILAFLMQHPGRVFSRSLILDAVWGYTGYDESLINTHIKRLRAKLEEDPNHPRIILTVRGFGYKLVEPPPPN